MELYKTDFWVGGRPTKSEPISIDKTGAFSLSDSKDGLGEIEIGITLKKHETEAFGSLFASSQGGTKGVLARATTSLISKNFQNLY